ncbi:MAG: AmmeMemoRadiSam system protein B [Planctomycetes bacterium]|nr:AmmeMemoRadiSam system protein B [Planctomycetota bacterium]
MTEAHDHDHLPERPERPRLRPFVEALPVRLDELGGEPAYVLKDPWKLAERQVVLPLPGLMLAALFDGTRTPEEARAEFSARHGVELPLARVHELRDALEAALLLEGPHLERAVDAFRRATVRPAACAGSYTDARGVTDFLEAQWRRPGGPGAPPGPAREGGRVRALVSPHIDLHRGGHSYAHVWKAVAEECPAELFVVFGTSHTGTAPLDGRGRPTPFALTRKAFDTPAGQVPVDHDALGRLVDAYDGEGDLFAGEFHHRGEHSIEFQAVYLAHLFGGRRPVRILPILCGGLHDLAGRPGDDARLEAFHRALARALAPVAPEKVAFVAAIDLAHVGAQFHAPPVDAAALDAIAAQDRRTMDIVLARDPDAVHEDIARDGDPRSICGHAPLVALARALRDTPLQGELVHYDRWYDGESAVSFAGAVFRA